MIQTLITYYDPRLGVYSAPMTIQYERVEDVIEIVRRMCAAPEFNPIMFEYDLYYLGTFNDKVGSFTLDVKPVFLAHLGDFKLKEKTQDENQDIQGA